MQVVAKVLKMLDASSEKKACAEERFLLALHNHEINTVKILDTLQ